MELDELSYCQVECFTVGSGKHVDRHERFRLKNVTMKKFLQLMLVLAIAIPSMLVALALGIVRCVDSAIT